MAQDEREQQSVKRPAERREVSWRDAAGMAWAPEQGLAGWIGRHWQPLLWGCIVLALVLSILRFDAKVSIGGDDSWYILAALDFWNGVAFPQWHGAFYPILLSPLVGLAGIRLPLIKLFSVVFTLAAIYFVGRGFRGRVHPVGWLSAVLLMSVSPLVIELASSTYSEPLFMLLQALVFVALFRLGAFARPWASRSGRLSLLWLGLSLFLLALTRNVGYGALLTVLLYLLVVRRSWQSAAGVLVAFFAFQLPYSLYMELRWGASKVSFGGQLSRMLQVDFYNASAGQEDLSGMLVRFWQNSQQYLTFQLPRVLGFDVSGISVFFTILLIVLGGVLLWWAWGRSRVLVLVGLYLAIMLGITFITQQVAWNQARLVVIYIPLLALFYLGGIAALRSQLFGKLPLYATMVLSLIAGIAGLVSNARHIDIPTLGANLRGDPYVGLTPDWDSYLRASAWAGEHIPDSVVVACRKPNNSRIYGNRPFFGVFKMPSYNADTVRMYLDSNRVEYIIAGHLRRTPEQRTEYFINTIHVMLSVVLRERADYLELVQHFGSAEPAYVFRLYRDSVRGSNSQYRARMEAGLLVDPYNIEALHKLALLSLEERQPDESLAYVKRAVNLLTMDGQTEPYPLLEVQGIAHYAKGDFYRAVRDFETAVRLYPDEPRGWYNLGICYERVGDTRARASFAKSRALGGKR